MIGRTKYIHEKVGIIFSTDLSSGILFFEVLMHDW